MDDNDIDKLLEALENTDGEVESNVESDAVEPDEIESDEETSLEAEETEETCEDGNCCPAELDFAISPVDVRSMSQIIEQQPKVTEVAVPQFDVQRYFDKLDQVTDEVLRACRSDRHQTEQVIDMLRARVDNFVAPTNPPAALLDNLVKSIEVKANINATAVKMLEANAKMIAACKSSLNINNNNFNVSSGDLEEILSQPQLPMDEEA